MNEWTSTGAPEAMPATGAGWPGLKTPGVVPDELQFACGACGAGHMLTRDLDYVRQADGSWLCEEPGGFECDCGVRLVIHFRLSPVGPINTGATE